jgi:hypothetical protein
MSRNTLGIVAALLLLAGIVIWWRGPGGENALGLAFGCIRVGLVLGALWLAFPQLAALAKVVPAALWGRFAGKGKPGVKSSSASSQAEVVQEPARVRRPRRRSSA